MLVPMKETLRYAEEHHCAIGSFNTPTLENIVAVLACAEKAQVPVILMHAEIHESVAPLAQIGPVMVLMAKQAKIPVAVHLDHGQDVLYIEKALALGFSSVMFDGSLLPYEDNVRLTSQTVQIAKKYGASVEGEIGVLGGRGETVGANPTDRYTDPDLAKRFVDATGIDALACSFGTAHGLYKTTPQLDFPRIRKIRDLTHLPLVMHGGSGLPFDDYEKAIDCGIRKINYYTYMAKAGLEAAKNYLSENPDAVFYHDLAYQATAAMEENVARLMKVFYRF